MPLLNRCVFGCTLEGGSFASAVYFLLARTILFGPLMGLEINDMMSPEMLCKTSRSSTNRSLMAAAAACRRSKGADTYIFIIVLNLALASCVIMILSIIFRLRRIFLCTIISEVLLNISLHVITTVSESSDFQAIELKEKPSDANMTILIKYSRKIMIMLMFVDFVVYIYCILILISFYQQLGDREKIAREKKRQQGARQAVVPTDIEANIMDQSTMAKGSTAPPQLTKGPTGPPQVPKGAK